MTHVNHRIETRALSLDEERFLGAHGIRSVSKWHKNHPYVFMQIPSPYSRLLKTLNILKQLGMSLREFINTRVKAWGNDQRAPTRQLSSRTAAEGHPSSAP